MATVTFLRPPLLWLICLSVKSVKSAVKFLWLRPHRVECDEEFWNKRARRKRRNNSALSVCSCSKEFALSALSASICGQFRIQPPLADLGVSPLPLWGQYDTQVANVQPLATIRIFSHFSIDIHTYQLYNCPRMVRNEWTNGNSTKEAKAENSNAEN